MSLRMNLYGFELSRLKRALGSKESAVFEAAAASLADCYLDEPELSLKANAWLRTLLERGYVLREVRGPPIEPADGGPPTFLIEREFHIEVVYWLVRALAHDDDLDLMVKSSRWKHGITELLKYDVNVCGFARSGQCSVEFYSFIERLCKGSPLFGDDFRTSWSFYTIFTNAELAAMIPDFQVAVDFKRPIPSHLSEKVAKTWMTAVSDESKEFMEALIEWFGQIQKAGQDAFILWY